MPIQTTGTQEGDIKAGYINAGVYDPNKGSLQGTMTQPQPQTPQTPPAPNISTTQPGSFADMMNLQSVLGTMEAKLKQNSNLMSQRNLVLKSLYDQPLTPEELNQLDPSLQQAIKSGDRNQIDMQLRLISDEVSGRTATLDQSVQYLSQTYQTAIKEAETQKQNAITNFLSHAQTLQDQGYDPVKAFETLYPNAGIDWSGLLGGTTSPDMGGGSNINVFGIKYSPTTAGYGGSDSGVQAKDGGTFLASQGVEGDRKIAQKLLTSPVYSDMTIDAALKKWSNNGYGYDPGQELDPQAKIKDLPQDQIDKLLDYIQKREGVSTAPSNVPSDEQEFVQGLTPQGQQLYLKQSPNTRSALRQLINGDLLLSDIPGFSGAGAKLKLLELAGQVEPGFSSNVNKRRYQFQQAWFNPTAAPFKTRTSVNTALGHMAQAYKDFKSINNTTIKKYNSLINMLKSETGDPAVASFNYDITQLASEIAAVYKGGTAPTDQEVEQERNALLASLSPAQGQAVFDRAAKLMSSKITSMSEEYRGAMGTYPIDPIVQDFALQELQDSGVNARPIIDVLKTQGYDVSKYQTQGGGQAKTVQVGNDTYQLGPDGLYYKI